MGSSVRILHGVRYLSLLLILFSVVGAEEDYEPPYQVSYEFQALQPRDIEDRKIPFALSLDDDHVCFAVKYKQRVGGGKIFIYRKGDDGFWKEVFVVNHPEEHENFGEAVLLDIKRKYLFGSVSFLGRGMCEHGDAKCGHVLWYRLEEDGDELKLAGDPVEIANTEASLLFGWHLDRSGNRLLITDYNGFQVFDIENLVDGKPRHIQTTSVVANAPEKFDETDEKLRPIVEKCEINDDFIVCGVPVHNTEIDPKNYPPPVVHPWISLYKWDGTQYAFDRNFLYEELAPADAEHWYHVTRLPVAIDKDSDTIIVGVPMRGYDEWQVFDEEGNVAGVERADFDNGRVFILDYNENSGEWSSQEMMPLDYDVIENYGYSVSASHGDCVACRHGGHPDGCYVYKKVDDAWSIDKLLMNRQVNDTFFAHDVEVHQGVAVITSNRHIFFYNDIDKINTISHETEAEGDNLWCYGARSSVHVQRAGSSEIENLALEDVQVGDKVKSIGRDGKVEFSEVFLVQHASENSDQAVLVVQYEADDGILSTLEVSPGHLLPVRRSSRGYLYATASELREGSVLFAMNGDGYLIEAHVKSITQGRARVRNVHTVNDHLIVSGVFGSCITTVPGLNVSATLWQQIVSLLVSPLKLLHRAGMPSVVKALDAGANTIASTMASGLSRMQS
eukprot:CAMPEP_0198736724 /NCGR_PEP_ID=MMETSP1475-20131203/67502_1 /TAXON_ID= ORGANISM="Unidentified sp., Strain CCMP1999" /NCGR_SAMPLE_ID=MMETSP1475 /ASSEMBLY_ACC=CAM_ASM_001111 /LENGTH=673 /DNA_ID=CAMNT_0044500573 /DNA_START=44 /DNA_END=2065 /DNA_ORIENTATION=-